MNNTINTDKRWLVWLYFIFLFVVWGSSFILIKRGLEVYTVWQAASIRLIAAFVVLGGFAIVSLKKVSLQKLPVIILSGLLSMFIPSYLFCAAQIGISSSIAGILNALTPAFTFIIGVIFFRQSISKMQIAGLLIGFAGTAIMLLFNSTGNLTINAYAFFVVAATICYGININLVKKYLADVNPFHFTVISVSSSGLLALLYMLLMNKEPLLLYSKQNIPALLAVVILGIMGTALAQIALNKLIKASSPIFASSYTYVIPFVAIIWGLMDGEILHVGHIFGMILILAGVYILKRV